MKNRKSARSKKMKIAYLFFVYKNPRLIKKTVEYLSCDDASFFLHVDAKASLDQFASIRGENIFFTSKRIPVYWAEFSGVEAILQLIREALAAPQRHEYFVLLSGSEFPLRSPQYIHRFLEANRGAEFITMMKMPAPGKPIARLNTVRFPSTRPILRFVSRALAKVGLAQRDYRKHFDGLEPYSGVTWWALSREACEYVIEFTRNHGKLAKYFETMHAPEETFIHTILGNSPFKSRVRRNLLFEDWDQDGPRHHPNILGGKHVALFESQEAVAPNDSHGPCEMLFARKFSDDVLPLVERIAAMIAKKEKLPPPNAR